MKDTVFHQKSPFQVPAEGGKIIHEHFGRASTGDASISIAKMTAPPGWGEPYQIPEFDEYVVVFSGKKLVETEGREITLHAGESIMVPKGCRVRYSNPFEEAAEYIAICVPAFWPEGAHRQDNTESIS